MWLITYFVEHFLIKPSGFGIIAFLKCVTVLSVCCFFLTAGLF